MSQGKKYGVKGIKNGFVFCKGSKGSWFEKRPKEGEKDEGLVKRK